MNSLGKATAYRHNQTASRLTTYTANRINPDTHRADHYHTRSYAIRCQINHQELLLHIIKSGHYRTNYHLP